MSGGGQPLLGNVMLTSDFHINIAVTNFRFEHRYELDMTAVLDIPNMSSDGAVSAMRNKRASRPKTRTGCRTCKYVTPLLLQFGSPFCLHLELPDVCTDVGTDYEELSATRPSLYVANARDSDTGVLDTTIQLPTKNHRDLKSMFASYYQDPMESRRNYRSFATLFPLGLHSEMREKANIFDFSRINCQMSFLLDSN